jgi:hypothetical protein
MDIFLQALSSTPSAGEGWPANRTFEVSGLFSHRPTSEGSSVNVTPRRVDTASLPTANPIPSVASPTTLKETTPATVPSANSSGPPLTPGLIGTSVWTTGKPPASRYALTIPRVTVSASVPPPGDPMAHASAPVAAREGRSGIQGLVATDVRRSARSATGSRRTTSASAACQAFDTAVAPHTAYAAGGPPAEHRDRSARSCPLRPFDLLRPKTGVEGARPFERA